MKVMDDVIVIGAGISGLVIAKQVATQGKRVRLVEARPFVGGRLRTVDGIDTGAAWTWPGDKHVRSLAKELGVGLFAQPADGKLVYDSSWGAQEQRDEGAAGPGASRFAGGAGGLARRLHESLDVPTHLNAAVTAIRVDDDGVACEMASGEVLKGRCAVVTAPPRVALEIRYDPPLPRRKREAMASIATWMADAMKVGLAFETPWWRERGYSGAVFSESGPLSQIWDNSDGDQYALAGFAFGRNMLALKAMPEPELKATVLAQLKKVYGSDVVVGDPTRVVSTAWLDEPYTFAPNPAAQTRSYGRPELGATHASKLFFAGTETDPAQGHIEGAVRSGRKAAADVLDFLASAPASSEKKTSSCAQT